MAPSEPTIIDLKTSFLRTQIHQLSNPVSASPRFLASTDLQDRHVEEALSRVNGLLKTRVKTAYAPQVQRHVAEQIDALYWGAGRDDVRRDMGDEGLERGVDYREFPHLDLIRVWGMKLTYILGEDQMIEELPSSFPSSSSDDSQSKYTEYRSKLVELSARRKELQGRIEGYRKIKELLGPLDGARENVQPNIVVKNGELEAELEKMRMLMLRVERGVGELPNKEEGEGMDADEVDVYGEARERLMVGDYGRRSR
ncbi:hypothetical protein B7494_g5676 [Chlorociboria aeruginascens]|nr:hypothetical protein B7494_g5676 [Chlorociboria aeruginascens]